MIQVFTSEQYCNFNWLHLAFLRAGCGENFIWTHCHGEVCCFERDEVGVRADYECRCMYTEAVGVFSGAVSSRRHEWVTDACVSWRAEDAWMADGCVFGSEQSAAWMSDRWLCVVTGWCPVGGSGTRDPPGSVVWMEAPVMTSTRENTDEATKIICVNLLIWMWNFIILRTKKINIWNTLNIHCEKHWTETW